MAILRQGTILGALGIILAGSGCGRDLFLSTSNLEIGPSPTQPGGHGGRPPVPLLVQLGDAADLIAVYGTGVHNAYVEVHVSEENQTTRTQSASFELQEAAP